MAKPKASAPRMDPVLALMLFLTATYGVGFIGAQGAMQGLGFWYVTLNKPTWGPPPWVFAPAWTLLYAFMATAAWMVWREPPGKGRKIALTAFAVQLFLNGLWPWVFFAHQRIGPALVNIAAMDVFVLATAILFGRIRRSAGWLFVPYLAWLAFATALNTAIFRLNP